MRRPVVAGHAAHDGHQIGDEPEDAASSATDKAPLSRTLDRKEVEDEVAEALGRLGHDASLHVLDGSTRSLHALARTEFSEAGPALALLSEWRRPELWSIVFAPFLIGIGIMAAANYSGSGDR